MNFEDELIIYKQKITTILESFTDAFFEVDLNWSITYWNKECERLLGKTKAEVLGKNLWEEFNRAISLKFYTEYHKAMRENLPVKFQEYWPQKKMWVEVSAFPFGEGLSVFFKDITEWKRITGQLKKEKKRYYDLFNQSPLPQWVYDFNTLSILQVNDAAIKQYGYSRKEFLKMALEDMGPPEDIIQLTKILNTEISKSRFNSSIVRHRKKNGEIIYVTVGGNSVFFENKNARLVMAVDQTEQINAELVLARSEQRFKTLVQNGSDLIGILDSQGMYKYVSPTSEPILGIEASHFIGKNAFDFIHPEDRSATLAQFEMLINERQIKLRPFRFIDGKGTYRWIETVVTNLINDPAIEGIVSNSRDVTERVENELKTEELLNRFNIVSKATIDAIWDWDIATGKIQWNQAISSVYGYNQPSFDILWWEQQVHPDDLHVVQQKFEKLIQSKNSRLQLEYRFRCADGIYRSVLDRSFVLFDLDGKPTRMIGSMEDITERIAYTQAIEQQNTRLHEIALIQAHDVRAPLAKIIGLVNLLDSNMNAEALANIVKHLKCSTNDLDNVIKRMINKSQ